MLMRNILFIVDFSFLILLRYQVMQRLFLLTCMFMEKVFLANHFGMNISKMDNQLILMFHFKQEIIIKVITLVMTEFSSRHLL